MNPHSSSAATPNLLRHWQVEAPADPDFRAAVWTRIEGARQAASLSWAGYFRRNAQAWSLALVLALSVSALVGYRAGERHSERERAAILQTYLAAIDARAMVP